MHMKHKVQHVFAGNKFFLLLEINHLLTNALMNCIIKGKHQLITHSVGMLKIMHQVGDATLNYNTVTITKSSIDVLDVASLQILV